jgi:hypothetical protein
MMDIDQIDNSLYEIKQMVMVAIGATDDLIGSDVEPGFFCRGRMRKCSHSRSSTSWKELTS